MNKIIDNFLPLTAVFISFLVAGCIIYLAIALIGLPWWSVTFILIACIGFVNLDIYLYEKKHNIYK
jgi:hypothetical protein